MPRRCTTLCCVETGADGASHEEDRGDPTIRCGETRQSSRRSRRLEVQNLQFSGQVMDVPVVMKDRCVRFRRADNFEANTVPEHRQDRRCSRVATTRKSIACGEDRQGPTGPVKRTMDAFDSDVQKIVEFTRVQHIEKIVVVPVVMRQDHYIDRVIVVAVVQKYQVQPSSHRR